MDYWEFCCGSPEYTRGHSSYYSILSESYGFTVDASKREDGEWEAVFDLAAGDFRFENWYAEKAGSHDNRQCMETVSVPHYTIVLEENKPQIKWDFHSLLRTIHIMLSFALADEAQPLRICKECGKVYYATDTCSQFCSKKCKNRFGVSENRAKKKRWRHKIVEQSIFRPKKNVFMNVPTTALCMFLSFEKHMVFLQSRLILVRSVKWLRSIC